MPISRHVEKQQCDPYRQSALDEDAHHPVVQMAKLILANSREHEKPLVAARSGDSMVISSASRCMGEKGTPIPEGGRRQQLHRASKQHLFRWALYSR